MLISLSAIRKALERLLHAEAIHYIGGSDTLPPPLPRSEEAEAIAALDAGDAQAKALLIEHNLRLLLSDILGTDADEVIRPLEDDADREMLRIAIDTLPEREKQIILLRYGFIDGTEYTQKEVASLLGISQSYISRLEKRIIERLHSEMLKLAQ